MKESRDPNDEIASEVHIFVYGLELKADDEKEARGRFIELRIVSRNTQRY